MAEEPRTETHDGEARAFGTSPDTAADQSVDTTVGSEVTFLLVDDDEVAIMAIKRAIRKLRYTNEIVVARDGVEALEKLRDPGIGLAQKPYIILLDINMPKMTGLEFLAECRNDAALRRSVVYMLTTSEAPSDIAAAYDHLVAGYILKEDALDSLRNAMEMLGAYVRIVQLPVRPDQGDCCVAGPRARILVPK